jgi:hypothetical protein
VEPEDMETLSTELTPTLAGCVDAMVEKVLFELDRLEMRYERRDQPICPSTPFGGGF